jgi:hypothetical protein
MAFLPFVTNLLGVGGVGEAGGLLYTYTRGTTSPLPVYSDLGVTPTANPFVADANGQVTIYFSDALDYSWVAKTADGATTLWEADVVDGVLTFTYLNDAYVPFDTGRINVRNYEVTGQTDWTTAIVTAAAAAYASGKALWFPADDTAYVTDCQNFASPINIILDPGATVQLKASATLDGANLYIFRLRASNSSIVGGTFDFNRANQDRAAFNTAGGSSVRNYYGVRVLGTLATHIENVKVHTRVINCADFGVAWQYCDGYDSDVEVATSGCGVIFVDCDGGISRRARLVDLDNSDWEVFPHAFDAFNCDGGQFDNIDIIDQAGYDIASGNSLSDWFTGITIADCENLSGSNWYVCAKNDTTMTKSVGISMLGLTKSNFSNITVRRYTSVHLELGALDNCDFANIFLDGEYMTTSLFAGEAQYGCHLINQGLYSNLTSRIRRPLMNCTFTNMQAVRMLKTGLIVYLAADCQWIGGKFNGNQYGIDIRSDNVNSSFLAPEIQVSARLKFVGVEARWNEIAGIWNGGSTDLDCEACDFSNNGQAANNTGDALRLSGTLAIATAGYLGNNSATTVARLRPRLADCTFQDDQTVTTAFGSVNPSAPTIVSVERPELYAFGQTITINNGATGPADLIAQVLDINGDELTISTAMTNFPLVAGTGTITTSSTTITAFSSSQAAIITGRMWIKIGSEYRQVIAVASNGLSGTLASAFSSNQTTAAFDIVKTEVEQMRSQDYGLSTLSSANDTGLTIVDPKWGAGNKLGNYSLVGAVNWSDSTTVSTLADLLEVSPRNGQIANVLGRNSAGDGGGGQFRFISGDQSANVTLDPNTGIWIAPTAASSGSSGAWKRVLDSYTNVNPYWWASAATAAGLKTGLTRAVTWLSAVYTSSDECGVVFPPGSHSIDGDITIERPRTVIESLDGVAELNITSTFTTGIVFQVTGAGSSATASDYLIGCGLRGGIRIVHSPSSTSAAAAGGTTLWFRQCQNIIWDDQVNISSTAFYGVRLSGGQLNDTMGTLRISGRYAPPTRRVTASNSGTEVLTSAAHGWTTGWRLVAMDTAAGVTNGSFYYVRVIDADTFTLHPTKADAAANTNTVNITASIAGSSPQLRLRRIGSAVVRIEEAECASGVYQTPYTCGWDAVSPIGDTTGTVATVSGITQANPAVVTTSAAHNFVEGQEVRLSGIGGMTEIIGGCYIATNITSTTFEVQVMDADGAAQNVNSTGYTAFTSGGSATPVTRYDFLVDLERADGFWINRGYWGSCRYAFIHMHREREFGGIYGVHFNKIYCDSVDADSTAYRSPLYIEWVPADDFSGTVRVLADHDGCQVANLRSQASSYGVKYHNATCLSIKWSNTDFRSIARRMVDISGSGGGTFQFSNCTFASGGVGAGALIATDDVFKAVATESLIITGCYFEGPASGKTQVVLTGTHDHVLIASSFNGTGNDIDISAATLTNSTILNTSGATSALGNRMSESLYVINTITNAPGASVTPANNGDVTWQLTSNTSLTFKAKGSDGTVRSGSVTLS